MTALDEIRKRNYTGRVFGLTQANANQLRDDVEWLLSAAANNTAELVEENSRLRQALELIAAPKRPDGTYNRCREACEALARDALKR